MNGYVGQNTKNVEEFIEYIRVRIIAAANNWKEVAKAFAEAKEMYGFESDAFKRLCKVTKFSKSKASKLATIATSERLKNYEKELAAVHSWTVLYAITTLNDEQFQRLLRDRDNTVENTGDAEIISMAMVNAARNSKSERSSMRVYAKVYVDIDAIRGRVMDGENIAALERAIRDIQVSVPYIKIEKTHIEEKSENAYLRSLQDAFNCERRRAFGEAVDKKLGERKKMTHESREQHEKRVLGQSRASVMQQFIGNEAEAFRMIADEYNEGELWDRAQERVSKELAVVVKRVKARGDAFVHANSAIQQIKDEEDALAESLRIAKEMRDKRHFTYRKTSGRFDDFI